MSESCVNRSEPVAVVSVGCRPSGELADGLDAELYGLSPGEARTLDARQRLLLKTAWDTLDAAGLDPVAPGRLRIGLYAGTATDDRVAAALGLTLEPAATSSVGAVHLAAQAVRAGAFDLALAGGADADGVGLLLLAPLTAARAHDRHVRALVLSSTAGRRGCGRTRSGVPLGAGLTQMIIGLDESTREPPSEGEPSRRVGLSSDDAHVVFERAAVRGGEPSAAPVSVWTLSADAEAGLRARSGRLRDRVADTGSEGAADLDRTLDDRAVGRHRAAIVCGAPEENLRALDALRRGRRHPALLRGTIGSPGPTAFVLPGQGAQLPGMGKALYAAHPVFATALDAVLSRLGPGIAPVMWGESRALLNQTMYAQPALFAFQVALYRLLESWGIVADYFIGHSIGELTAAHLSGVFSLEDACTLVTARSLIMQTAPTGGSMITVEAGEEEAAESLAAYQGPGQIDIASADSPRSVVLSGDEEAIENLAEHWRARGRRIHRLEVSHAFHSAHMDPVLQCLHKVMVDFEPGPPTIPLISNLTGARATVGQLHSDRYWADLIRRTVRFEAGVETLLGLGTVRFVELGPRPTLLRAVGETAGSRFRPGLVPAIHPGLPELQGLARAVASVHVSGGHVDWLRFQQRPPNSPNRE